MRWNVIRMWVLVAAIGGSLVAEARSLSMGVQGGLTFANMSAPTGVSTASRTGFLAGINVDVPLNNVLSIQPEALYAQRGAELTAANGGRVSVKYDALEVPVYLKARFGESIAPYVLVGPNFIFNLGTRLEGDAVAFKPRTFDMAVDAGVGLSAGVFFSNLRYSVGIIDVNEDAASWRSRGFELLAGLQF